MKKEIRGFVSGFLVCLMVMSFTFAGGFAKTIKVMFNSVNITVNDVKVKSDNIVYNGTTYVPLRSISEMLNKEVIWEASINTVKIKDKGTPTSQQNKNTTSRTSPATINQTVTVVNADWYYGKQNYDITLLELVSGDAALKMVKEANQFNDAPKDGKEYVLAKFKIKVNSLEKDTIRINNSMFELFSATGTKYSDFVSVAGLKPAWQTELFQGAEFEGWAYFLVDKGDTPVAVINRSNESAAVWFKLR